MKQEASAQEIGSASTQFVGELQIKTAVMVREAQTADLSFGNLTDILEAVVVAKVDQMLAPLLVNKTKHVLSIRVELNRSQQQLLFEVYCCFGEIELVTPHEDANTAPYAGSVREDERELKDSIDVQLFALLPWHMRQLGYDVDDGCKRAKYWGAEADIVELQRTGHWPVFPPTT